MVLKRVYFLAGGNQFLADDPPAPHLRFTHGGLQEATRREEDVPVDGDLQHAASGTNWLIGTVWVRRSGFLISMNELADPPGAFLDF